MLDSFGLHEEFDLARPVLPAWVMSMVLHMSLFALLALVLRSAPQGISVEPDRMTGIAVVKDVDGERQYLLETDAATESAQERVPSSREDLVRVLPSPTEQQVDLSGILPSKADGASDVAGGLSELGDALKGGQRTTYPTGDVSTSVFGLEGTGTRFVYVFDRSGSMDGFGGGPLRAAKSELLASLDDLQRTNQFQIIFYNERTSVFNPTGGTPTLVWGDEAGKELAKRFVLGITATGGTRHMAALSLALGMQPDVVFFLTDADEPQMTEEELRRIRRLNSGTSIHAIEFGYGPKRSSLNFLKRLAEQNQGHHVYVDVAEFGRTRK